MSNQFISKEVFNYNKNIDNVLNKSIILSLITICTVLFIFYLYNTNYNLFLRIASILL